MIVCCGEALIDFIPTPEEKTFKACPGGSIMNIAVGLGRMGVPVCFLSRLSTDLFGNLLAKHLTDNNVDLRYCPQIQGQTTLAFVSLSEGAHEPQYAFYAEGAVDRTMTPADLPQRLENEVSVLHFGSISLVLEPGASALETLMRRESQQRVITLDPNVRPLVISDWDAYRARFEGWLKFVDILRLSEVDLELLYPGKPITDLMPSWFEMGVSLVILTQGASGATAFTASGEQVFVPVEKVAVRDTVGAGDTFFSALLTYLYEGGFLVNAAALAALTQDTITACLRFANRAAAINCTREGADPPYRSEMD